MYRVRYYDQMIHPDHFSKGVLGWTIRALNWLRWKLETYNQKLTLKYLAREGGVPKEKEKSLLAAFGRDVRAEQLQMEESSPEAEPVIEVSQRAEKYREGSFRSVLDQAKATEESGKPTIRPKPIDELASRYGHQTRSKKYAKGRLFMNGEDDFEPIPKASGKLIAIPGGK